MYPFIFLVSVIHNSRKNKGHRFRKQLLVGPASPEIRGLFILCFSFRAKMGPFCFQNGSELKGLRSIVGYCILCPTIEFSDPILSLGCSGLAKNSLKSNSF